MVSGRHDAAGVPLEHVEVASGAAAASDWMRSSAPLATTATAEPSLAAIARPCVGADRTLRWVASSSSARSVARSRRIGRSRAVACSEVRIGGEAYHPDREPSGCETTTTADLSAHGGNEQPRWHPGGGRAGAREKRDRRNQPHHRYHRLFLRREIDLANDVSRIRPFDVFGIPGCSPIGFKSVRAYRRCCCRCTLGERRHRDRAHASPYRTFPKVCMSSLVRLEESILLAALGHFFGFVK